MAINTINQTTLSGALTETATSLKVAAATYVKKDYILFVDGEAIKVLADPDGTFCPAVFRGWAGTQAQSHASGAVVWTAPGDQFYEDSPRGGTGSTNSEYAMPHINAKAGVISVLSNGVWTEIVRNGIPVPMAGGSFKAFTTNATTAIPLIGGTYTLTTGAATSFTLATPDGTVPEGTRITFVCGDASQPTVTVANGDSSGFFLGTTTTSDVATFAAAAGGSFTVAALNGRWQCVAVSTILAGTAASVTFG